MRQIKQILVLVFIAAVVILAAQNFEILEVRFLFWSFSMQRAIMLFAVFVAGVAVGYVLRRKPESDGVR